MSLSDLASEYRRTSARISMRIHDLKAAGCTDTARLKSLRKMLAEVREIQRVLDGYYTMPREHWSTSAQWRARGPSDEDH